MSFFDSFQVLTGGLLFAIALIVFIQRLYSSRHRQLKRIHEQFQLPDRAKIIGGDLGDLKSAPILEQRLSGITDLLAHDADSRSFIVGEFKGRSLSRYRRMRPRELFQLTLYGGMYKKIHKADNIVLLLRYKDALIQIPFCQTLYLALLRLSDEAFQSRQQGKPIDSTPLLKRDWLSPGLVKEIYGILALRNVRWLEKPGTSSNQMATHPTTI